MEFFEFVKDCNTSYHMSSWGVGSINYPFDIRAIEYLNYAEDDLKINEEKSLINALGNIKRSIDCRVEEILFLFGYWKLAKKKNWSFGNKTKLLTDLGVVTPRVLNKINKKRNEIEHDFKRPDIGDVEDYFDIAHLFILATNKYVNIAYDEVVFEGITNEMNIHGRMDVYPRAYIELDSINSKFNVRYFINAGVISPVEIEIFEGKEYIELLKIWIDSL